MARTHTHKPANPAAAAAARARAPRLLLHSPRVPRLTFAGMNLLIPIKAFLYGSLGGTKS
jgi:hypothetical protein